MGGNGKATEYPMTPLDAPFPFFIGSNDDEIIDKIKGTQT